MEKNGKTLIFVGIVLVALIFGLTNFVYASEKKCAELSNYVERIYFIHGDNEDNFVEFDISASEKMVPVYIYIDEPVIQQMFILNLTQKKGDDRYFDRVKINLKNTYVSEIYLDRPGIHTLLITTDGHYYREDISNLCAYSRLFSWDDVPGKDDEQLLKHLKEDLKIEWVENAEIKKSKDNKTITVEKEGNSITIKLNEVEKMVILKTPIGETFKYLLEEEEGKRIVCTSPCNVLPHPCRHTDRILKHIKVVSKEKTYGIMYKLKGLKEINESISYLEKPVVMENIGNFIGGYRWKLFLLSNSSAVEDAKNNEDLRELIENATKTEMTFDRAVVVEGTVYDKDANPVKNAVVGVYIVGIEAKVIHIMTITDDKGKFKIYHKPAGNYTYRLPEIFAFNPNDKWQGIIYSELVDSVDMSAPPKKYIKGKEFVFPVVETLIFGIIIGTILVLFEIGYINKIIDALTRKKKKSHGHA